MLLFAVFFLFLFVRFEILFVCVSILFFFVQEQDGFSTFKTRINEFKVRKKHVFDSSIGVGDNHLLYDKCNISFL